jgi:hypothetical protein
MIFQRLQCHTLGNSLGQQLLLLLLLLELLAIALLQPAVARHVSVVVLVLLHRLQVLADARDLGRAALLGRVVGRLDPAQRRARGEQVQQHRGKFVCHREWVAGMRSSWAM